METVDTFLIVAVLFFIFCIGMSIFQLGKAAGIRWCTKRQLEIFNKVHTEHELD